MPKILYVGRFDKPWNEEGIAKTFEDLGCEILRFSEIGFDLQSFREICVRQKPDYVMWAKLRIPSIMRPEVVKLASDLKIKTICWVFDLYIGMSRQWFVTQRDCMFRATHVFTTDGGHEQIFKDAGINHSLLRQGILDLYKYTGLFDEEYAHDVVFVGCSNPEYPYRDKLIRKLNQRYGKRFKWYGRFSTNDIRGHELNKLYASSKVIVGDSVYSPNYWSNRIYETIGRGGFYIHPQVPGIEKEFVPYKHFVPYCYYDWNGLFEKIDYYLGHEKERNRIRIEGFKHCAEHHTFKKRCTKLLEQLGEKIAT